MHVQLYAKFLRIFVIHLRGCGPRRSGGRLYWRVVWEGLCKEHCLVWASCGKDKCYWHKKALHLKVRILHVWRTKKISVPDKSTGRIQRHKWQSVHGEHLELKYLGSQYKRKPLSVHIHVTMCVSVYASTHVWVCDHVYTHIAHICMYLNTYLYTLIFYLVMNGLEGTTEKTKRQRMSVALWTEVQ